METKLTEQESLKIIQAMIATSKNNLKDNRFFYLLWGWLVLVASISHYILNLFHWEYAFLPWPVLMISGTFISMIAGYRLGKKARVVSHVDKMIIFLWYGFFVVLTLVVLMALLQKISWLSAYPIIIALYGLGTFVSGGVLKFKPLMFGGAFCWLIAVVSMFAPADYLLLMVGLSVIVAYLVPGYLLKSKA